MWQDLFLTLSPDVSLQGTPGSHSPPPRPGPHVVPALYPEVPVPSAVPPHRPFHCPPLLSTAPRPVILPHPSPLPIHYPPRHPLCPSPRGPYAFSRSPSQAPPQPLVPPAHGAPPSGKQLKSRVPETNSCNCVY